MISVFFFHFDFFQCYFFYPFSNVFFLLLVSTLLFELQKNKLLYEFGNRIVVNLEAKRNSLRFLAVIPLSF